MNLFDIIGPVMVGPSSSHTAGASRIGYIARKLLGEDVKTAHIHFHGSFAATGKGHGTDRAMVAGLLGWPVDDARIPQAIGIAESQGVTLTFDEIDLGGDAHPNSAKLELEGDTRKLEIIACSLGGGRIEVRELDGLSVQFSAEHPTLIVQNDDQPAVVANLTTILSSHSINIATIQLNRDARGGKAVAVFELDEDVQPVILKKLQAQPGVLKVTNINVR